MLDINYIKNEYELPKTQLEKVEEEIIIDILTGKMHSGQRIVEQDLCQRFGLSRTPIRQVLNKIATQGLIRLEQNRGAIVNGLTSRDIDDMLQMRFLLEPQAVKWAIERITKEEMSLLEETFAFMEFYTRTDDFNKMVRINHGFDSIIYDACGNKELERTLQRYAFYIGYANSYILYPLNYLPTVLEEHRAIYNAFVVHDPEAGYEAAQVHAYKSMLRGK